MHLFDWSRMDLHLVTYVEYVYFARLDQESSFCG
jgi:hypothetical protein